ncbi:MAG: ATP-binding protein [Cuniculiplasma sp.]
MQGNNTDYARIRELLRQGMELQATGKGKDAKKLYGAALELLRKSYQSADVFSRERIKRQMDGLQKAMDSLEDKKDDRPSQWQEGEKILEETGLSISKGEGPTMSEVAGMEELKKELFLKIIYPLKFPDLAEEFHVVSGGGFILYGPPGNGKTFIVRALAREVDMNFIYVNPANLVSQWFGNFEKNISQLFRAARLLSPSILFFDELDSLFPSRDKAQNDASRRGVSQFLNEIGGFSQDKASSVVLLGATNVPWQLDEAVTRPGRFDRLIYVPPPDTSSRESIVKNFMSKVSRKDKIDYGAIAKNTEGYSSADVEYLCRHACQGVFRRAIENSGNDQVRTSDIEDAMKAIRPSVSRETIKKYEAYRDLKSSAS